jgi:hypothetical protein
MKEGDMGEACNTQQNYFDCIENANCKRRLRDLTIDRRIILKLMLIKWGVRTPDRLCGLVVRVPGYRSRVPGLIPGATRFSV